MKHPAYVQKLKIAKQHKIAFQFAKAEVKYYNSNEMQKYTLFYLIRLRSHNFASNCKINFTKILHIFLSLHIINKATSIIVNLNSHVF